MTDPLHRDVVRVLSGWTAPVPEQAALREAYLGFLAARSDACRRTCTPGHITASAVVLDASGRRTLLTLHPIVGRWLQLGGHLEGDATLADAALREATEESGIEGLTVDPIPLDLDVHPITCKGSPPTRHFDIRFLVTAPAGAVERRSDESDDLRWFDVSTLPAVSPELRTLVDRAAARAQGRSTPKGGSDA